jgi:glycosyltransferase involved in cell wall biosynthesis
MKIAQIAPLFESVPPKLYGGTERVASYLTEELVKAGHEVTLFASGDSETSAELVACSRVALRLDPAVENPLPYHVAMLDRVMQRADEFDFLHFHTDLLHYPLVRGFLQRTLSTQHGRLDYPDLKPFYRSFTDIPLAAISKDQRQPMPQLNWAGTVYNGLPRDMLQPGRGEEGYLAFLGRINPEKGPDAAIEIAAKAGLPLKIAAKIDVFDRQYWEEAIEPLVRRHPNVEYVGEVNEREKAEFLGKALALVFPITWREPFGLVMIEAMACGTPVVAFRKGAVPEVVEEGVSGFVVDSVDEAVAALGRIGQLDRGRVRAAFEDRFTAHTMAAEYLRVYGKLLAEADEERVTTPLRAADSQLRIVT